LLVLTACGGAATSVVEEESVAVEEPATGSNERFQAAEPRPEPAVSDDAAETVDPPPSFAPAPDGYVVWAHPVQPPGLAVADQVDGGLYTTSWIREGVLESLYRVDADRTYRPELLAADAEVIANDNGTVTIAYQLRSGLRWSDGEPLTTEDVAYTHRILMEGCLTEADGSAIDVSNEGCVYPLRDRTGYDLVTAFDVEDDTGFTIRMAAFYPDWRSLYPHIFAAHAFGDDATAVAANLEALATGAVGLPWSGPLVIEEWADGRLRLALNDHYHGSPDDDTGPTIAGVQVNFVPTTADAVLAVAGGEADVAVVAPSEELVSAAAGGGLGAAGVAAQPALEYEHLGLNLLDPHLRDPLVRRALVRAVSRSDLAQVFGPLVGAGLSADGVGNAFWLPGQSGYQDHQPAARDGDPGGAGELLVEAGYVEGGDGVFTHPERGRLRLWLLTNGGDSIRVALQQRLVDQLTAAGFDIVPQERQGGAFLTEGPFAEEAIEAAHSGGSRGDSDVWDMALFAWAGGPWPGQQSGAFRSQSGANPYGYANPEFDSESSRCDGLVEEAERSACYQALDIYVTTLDNGDGGLVVIPLVERPQLTVYNTASLAQAPALLDGPSGGPLASLSSFQLGP
jgi:peptide/nickel transport system substrate-binding protein